MHDDEDRRSIDRGKEKIKKTVDGVEKVLLKLTLRGATERNAQKK